MIHELAKKLALCGVPVFPCWDNKKPASPNGLLSASTTLSGNWPSSLFGVPIPPNVLIIDIDSYKGMTTKAIDKMLKCSLDWEGSLIQKTPSGGSHHAFYVTENVRQGADLFSKEIGKGFDTRAAGRGYICSGGGYIQAGNAGIISLISPESLPPLLPQAITALTVQTNTQHEQTPLPEGDRNADEINKMLRCLDAECSRSEWLNVALALKHHYHDNDASGWILFDNWSKTAPVVYDPIEALKLWKTIKPAREGQPTITLGTLVYKAIEQGYIPGRNAAEVFGSAPTGDTADIVDIEQLVNKINESGGKPENIDELTTMIRTTHCSDIQRVALTATLQRVLRNHDIKITEHDLRNATKPKKPTPPQPLTTPDDKVSFHELVITQIQSLGTIHIRNAALLRQHIFSDRLARFGSEPYWWNGNYWESVSKIDLSSKVAHAFSDSEYGKDGNVNGTRNQLLNIIPSQQTLNPASTLVFFKNGVLDPKNPAAGLAPHKAENFNASILKVDYNPDHMDHPHWTKFLNDCFSAEPTRIVLLQEIMGWWLISDNLNHQKAVAFDGVSRSGKGTIFQVMNSILGQGFADISMAQLADNKSLSSLRTAILGVDRDAKRPPSREVSTVHSHFNKITANEPISIPLLFTQDPWHGSLNCKLAIACNGIPILTDDSGAAPNRWLVIKFTEQFLGREDLKLPIKLMSEKASIAVWAVEGLQRLIVNGCFTIPLSSLEESHALIDSSSPVGQFADECLEIGSDYIAHGGLLWDLFKQWCSVTNNKIPNRNHFLRSLERSLQSEGVSYRRAVNIGGVTRTGLVGVRIRTVANNVTPIKSQIMG